MPLTSRPREELLRALSKDDPAMMVAAKAWADRVAIRQKAITRLYAPLRWFAGYRREYFDHQFEADMAEGIANIPEDQLITPPASVAIPAMERLGYSLDEPKLKEMYLNLIAAASDKRTVSLAHPAFAEIIKQLSPQEAVLLEMIFPYPNLPIVNLVAKIIGARGEHPLRRHLLDLRDDTTGEMVQEELVPCWVDNWVRLGLVEVDYDRSLTGDTAYARVEQRPEFQLLSEQQNSENQRVQYRPGFLATTSFGQQFAAAVTPSQP
jgi:hypothetical protein